MSSPSWDSIDTLIDAFARPSSIIDNRMLATTGEHDMEKISNYTIPDIRDIDISFILQNRAQKL